MDEKNGAYQEGQKIIDELFEEFNREEIRLKLLHDNNSSKIGELEETILQLTKSEDIDYGIFSPRNIVSTNKEKMNDLQKDKEKLIKFNDSIYEQMNYYKEKVKKLEQLCSLFKTESLEENIKPLYQDSENSLINVFVFDELKKVNHKLELCSKIIDNDPVRTKMELRYIMKKIDDIIELYNKN
ncbi:MAG: hypothetical protein QM697_04485 [Lachnospiraceae bacterium]